MVAVKHSSPSDTTTGWRDIETDASMLQPYTWPEEPNASTCSTADASFVNSSAPCSNTIAAYPAVNGGPSHTLPVTCAEGGCVHQRTVRARMRASQPTHRGRLRSARKGVRGGGSGDMPRQR